MTPASHPPVGRLLAFVSRHKSSWRLVGGCNYKPTVRPFVDSTISRRIDRPMRLPGLISRTPRILRQRRRLKDDISDVSWTLRRRDQTNERRKLALTITAAGEGYSKRLELFVESGDGGGFRSDRAFYHWYYIFCQKRRRHHNAPL